METSWCEVCQYEATGKTVEDLIPKWTKHIETDEHMNNVAKYLQYDLGITDNDFADDFKSMVKDI